MGFFSELKDDLSQAVNTILPSDDPAKDPLLAAAEAEEPEPEEPVIVDLDDMPDPATDIGVVIDAEHSGGRTIEDVFNEARELEAETGTDLGTGAAAEQELSLEGVDLDSMLSRIDELDADFGAQDAEEEAPEEAPAEESYEQLSMAGLEESAPEPAATEAVPEEPVMPDVLNEAIAAAMTPVEEAPIAVEEEFGGVDGADTATVESALSGAAVAATEPVYSEPAAEMIPDTQTMKQEEKRMEQMKQLTAPTDENAVITAGMRIDGDVTTSGSLDVIGKINGNVTASGKLNVTGALEGNLTAAEIYAENARITGEVRSSGAAKIGQSTVILGNIYANSAVITGAVKGDIDVHGPVVLDTTAIVMGNIKSQSVQINNGAVIEGMCSQSYAEVNPQAFFDGLDG